MTGILIVGGRRVAFVPAGPVAGYEETLAAELAVSWDAACAAVRGLDWAIVVDLDASPARVSTTGSPPATAYAGLATDAPRPEAPEAAAPPAASAAPPQEEAPDPGHDSVESADRSQDPAPGSAADGGAPDAGEEPGASDAVAPSAADAGPADGETPEAPAEPETAEDAEDPADADARATPTDADGGSAPAGSVPDDAAPAGDHDGATISVAELREARPATRRDRRRTGDEGNHDGATMTLAELRALRAAEEVGGDAEPAPDAPRADPEEPEGTPSSASPLPATTLAAAPEREASADTIVDLSADPPAPSCPRVRLSTGEEIALDRTVIIGRSPSAARVALDAPPRLVAVDSPQLDISRSHLELSSDDGSVIAADLRTTNGTLLIRGGADPVRLRPGERTVLVPGDVLDLGDEVRITVEERA